MDNSTLKNKVKTGSLWLIIANVFSVVIRIGSTAYLARLISPEDFGIFAAILMLLEVSKVLLMNHVHKNLILNPNDDHLISNGIYLALLHGGILCVGLIVSAPFFADFFQLPTLKQLIPSVAAMSILLSLSVVIEGVFAKQLNFDLIAWRNMLAVAFGTAGIAMLLASWGWGLWALIVGYVVAELIRFFFLAVQVKLKFRAFDFQKIKLLERNALSISMTSLVNQFALRGDNLIITKYLGAASLGLYSKGFQLVAMPTNLVGGALQKVGFSALSASKTDFALQKRIFLRLLELSALVLFPFGLLLYYLAYDIVWIVLGENWLSSVRIIQILALGIFLQFFLKVPFTILMVQERFTTLFWVQFAFAVLILLSAFLLYPKGIEGVAWAVVLSRFVTLVFAALAFNYKVPISLGEYWQVLRKALFYSVLFFLMVEVNLQVFGDAFIVRTGIPIALFLAGAFSMRNLLPALNPANPM